MKELTINLRMDRTQAKAATEEQIRDTNRIIDKNEDLAKRQKKGVSDVLTAVQAAERAKQQIIAKTNQALIEGQVKAQVAARQAAGETIAGFEKTGSAADKVAESLKGLAGSTIGLGGVIQVATSIADVMQKARENAAKLADDFIRQRDALREIASLSGGQSNNKSTIEFAKSNVRTGATPEEAKAFKTEFLNAGAQQIGPGKSLSQEQAEKYSEQMSAYATAKGLDPATTGNLAGSALGFQNFNAKGQGDREAGQSVARSIAVLESGQGRSQVLATQLQMLSASTVNEDEMKGVFKTPEEAAVAISIGAEKHDAQANELVQATKRGLYSKKEKEAATNKAAGIEDSDSFETRNRKMAKLIDTEAVNKGIRPDEYLQDKYEDQMTREGILTFYNRGVKGGVFDARKATLAGMNDPNMVATAVEKFQKDPEGAGPDRIAKAEKILAENERGAKRAGLETLRTRAEAEFEKSGMEDNPFQSAMLGFSHGLHKATFGLLPDAKESSIRWRMGNLLDQDREKAGLPKLNETPNGSMISPGYAGSMTTAGEDQALIAAFEELSAKIKENNELLARQQGNPNKVGPEPVPGPRPPLRGAPPVPIR